MANIQLIAIAICFSIAIGIISFGDTARLPYHFCTSRVQFRLKMTLRAELV